MPASPIVFSSRNAWLTSAGFGFLFCKKNTAVTVFGAGVFVPTCTSPFLIGSD